MGSEMCIRDRVTLANEDDNFVLVTTKPLPKFKKWSEEQQIKFIRERILGKTDEEIVKVLQQTISAFSSVSLSKRV